MSHIGRRTCAAPSCTTSRPRLTPSPRLVVPWNGMATISFLLFSDCTAHVSFQHGAMLAHCIAHAMAYLLLHVGSRGWWPILPPEVRWSGRVPAAPIPLTDWGPARPLHWMAEAEGLWSLQCYPPPQEEGSRDSECMSSTNPETTTAASLTSSPSGEEERGGAQGLRGRQGHGRRERSRSPDRGRGFPAVTVLLRCRPCELDRSIVALLRSEQFCSVEARRITAVARRDGDGVLLSEVPGDA